MSSSLLRFTPEGCATTGTRRSSRALVKTGRMQATAYPQGKVFDAAIQFARTEGTIPAPETSHAIRAVIDEALAAKERGEERVILFNYSGHGLLDLGAYNDYLTGQLDQV